MAIFVSFDAYEFLEEMVDDLCSRFADRFDKVPDVLLDQTHLTFMVHPVEGKCCPDKTYRDSRHQQLFWSKSPNQKGVCQFCRQPFVDGDRVHNFWYSSKNSFLERFCDQLFDSLLPVAAAEPSSKAALVAQFLVLATKYGQSCTLTFTALAIKSLIVSAAAPGAPEVCRAISRRCFDYIVKNAVHFSLVSRITEPKHLEAFCKCLFIGSDSALNAITALYRDAAYVRPVLNPLLCDPATFAVPFDFVTDLKASRSATINFIEVYLNAEGPCPPLLMPWKDQWANCVLPFIESSIFASWSDRLKALFVCRHVDWDSADRPAARSVEHARIMEIALRLLDADASLYRPLRVMVLDLFVCGVNLDDKKVGIPSGLFGALHKCVIQKSDVELAFALTFLGVVSPAAWPVAINNSMLRDYLIQALSKDYTGPLNRREQMGRLQLIAVDCLPHVADETLKSCSTQLIRTLKVEDHRQRLFTIILPRAHVVPDIAAPMIRFWPVGDAECLISTIQGAINDLSDEVKDVILPEIYARDDIPLPQTLLNLASPTRSIMTTRLHQARQRAHALVSKPDFAPDGVSATDLLTILSHACVSLYPLLTRPLRLHTYNPLVKLVGNVAPSLLDAAAKRFAFGTEADRDAALCLLLPLVHCGAKSSLFSFLEDAVDKSVAQRVAFLVMVTRMSNHETVNIQGRTMNLQEVISYAYETGVSKSWPCYFFAIMFPQAALKFPELCGLSKQQLLLRCIQEDEGYAHAYVFLASTLPSADSSILLGGTKVTKKQLLLRAIHLDGLFLAFFLLASDLHADEGIRLLSGQFMSKRQLYIEAISLNPSCHPARVSLAELLSDTETVVLSNGRKMTKEELVNFKK